MTRLEDPTTIEQIVGHPRHPTQHWARAEERDSHGRYLYCIYILHSQECVDSGIDLRDCSYSKALDVIGARRTMWTFWSWVESMPVPVRVLNIHGQDWLLPEYSFAEVIEKKKQMRWERHHGRS